MYSTWRWRGRTVVSCMSGMVVPPTTSSHVVALNAWWMRHSSVDQGYVGCFR